jgi:hypothetical protein
MGEVMKEAAFSLAEAKFASGDFSQVPIAWPQCQAAFHIYIVWMVLGRWGDKERDLFLTRLVWAVGNWILSSTFHALTRVGHSLPPSARPLSGHVHFAWLKPIKRNFLCSLQSPVLI